MKKTIITTSIIALLTSLTYAGEIIDSRYYGSTRDGSLVEGDIVNDLSNLDGDNKLVYYHGGTVNLVNAGQACGRVNGNIYNNLENVLIDGHYVGANWSNDSSGKPSTMSGVTGKVVNNISNSTITGKLYSGNLSSGPNAQWAIETIGSIETNITNSYVQELCVSGGALVNKIKGNVSVNIVNSTVHEIFHNGGTYIGGNCTIKLTDSKVTSRYFEGGGNTNLGSSYDWVTEKGINGDLNIILEGTTHVSYNVTGTIGNVNGKVNIVITDSVVVDGIITGGSGTAKEKILTIGTDTAFYNGTISVGDFDTIKISAGSKVEFANAFDVNTLIVERPQIMVFSSDAQVTLAEGTTFDTLTISGVEGTEVDLNTIFGDSAGVVLSAIQSEQTTLTVVDSKGQEWTTENLSFGEGNSISFELGTAIPEPSTYAMILGALALGFAIYRRRK